MSATIKVALESYLNSNVSYSIKFENIPYNTPPETYIEPDYMQVESYRKIIGGINNIEEVGIFYIWIYTKKDVGRFEMDNIISELIALYSEQKIGDVVCEVPQIVSPEIVGEKYRGGIRVPCRLLTTY